MKQVVLFIILSIPLLAFNQKRDQYDLFDEDKYFGIQFDDDFLFIGNRDEQYTGGLEFEYIQKSEKRKTKRGVFNPIANGQRYFTGAFGAYLYTPYNVSDSLIILNDRPFSSYIYTSFGYVSFSSDFKKRIAAEVFLGILGSELPGKIQSAVHTVGESPPTFGWDNRIAAKETFIPNFRLTYQEKLLTIGAIEALPFDWVQLGSYFEVNTGLYMNNLTGGLRLSLFNSVPKANSKFKYQLKSELAQKAPQFKWTGYFLPQFQMVLQNTTLQSLPWLNSPYTVTPDLMNRAVWILEGGLFTQYKRFHFNYMVQARSKEFVKFQKDWHVWAGITIGASF